MHRKISLVLLALLSAATAYAQGSGTSGGGAHGRTLECVEHAFRHSEIGRLGTVDILLSDCQLLPNEVDCIIERRQLGPITLQDLEFCSSVRTP